MATLKIDFPDQYALEAFVSWFSNSGEQGYQECLEMTYLDIEDPTPCSFKYHSLGEYLVGNIIRADYIDKE